MPKTQQQLLVWNGHQKYYRTFWFRNQHYFRTFIFFSLYSQNMIGKMMKPKPVTWNRSGCEKQIYKSITFEKSGTECNKRAWTSSHVWSHLVFGILFKLKNCLKTKAQSFNASLKTSSLRSSHLKSFIAYDCHTRIMQLW